MRAQDALAPGVLRLYLDLARRSGCEQGHLAAVTATLERFEARQAAHQGRVKVPDTQPGQYR